MNTKIGPYILEITIEDESSYCDVWRKVKGKWHNTSLDYIESCSEFETDDMNLLVTSNHKQAMLKWANANGY